MSDSMRLKTFATRTFNGVAYDLTYDGWHYRWSNGTETFWFDTLELALAWNGPDRGRDRHDKLVRIFS